MAIHTCISGSGRTIKDPHYLFSLEIDGKETTGNGEFPLGDFSAEHGIDALIGYLAMRGFGVTLGEKREWMERYKPVLVFTIVATGEVRRFDHTGQRIQ